MKARVLMDNINSDGMVSEWGLSIFIEYDEYKFLLDTGSSDKFIRNAKVMGIDLGDIDYGVLSHAHYDHADGMGAFFGVNSKASFYLREGTKENCYGKKFFFTKYVGIHKGWLEQYKDRIVYAKGNYEIVPGVTLIPHSTSGLDAIGKKAGMYVKENGILKPDAFAHEQSLVFDTEEGLVIFNSCSHAGADTIIKEVGQIYPGKKICALIGGFHLFSTPKRDVLALAKRIKETGIEQIYTGHCTGKRAFRILKGELLEGAHQMYTGLLMEWK